MSGRPDDFALADPGEPLPESLRNLMRNFDGSAMRFQVGGFDVIAFDQSAAPPRPAKGEAAASPPDDERNVS